MSSWKLNVHIQLDQLKLLPYLHQIFIVFFCLLSAAYLCWFILKLFQLKTL
jgi:hypothetical protein